MSLPFNVKLALSCGHHHAGVTIVAGGLQVTGGLTVEQGGPFAFSIGDPLVIHTVTPDHDTLIAHASNLGYQGDVVHEISSTMHPMSVLCGVGCSSPKPSCVALRTGDKLLC